MRHLFLLTSCLTTLSFTAHADVIDHTVTGNIAGRCEQLVFADARVSCGSGSVKYRSGTRDSDVIVALADGREIIFRGSRDSRPRPTEYELTLTSVYLNGSQSVYLSDDRDNGKITITGPIGKVDNVVGACRARMSPDGAIWRRLECLAHDAAGARFGLVLYGDGQRATFMLRGRSVVFPVMLDSGHR